MFKWLGNLVDSNEKVLKKLQPVVNEINELEPEFEKLTAEELKARTQEFKDRLARATADYVNRVEIARQELKEAKQRLAEAEDKFNKESGELAVKQLQERLEQVEKELQKAQNQALDDLIPEAFAAVREAAKRTIGQRHFDVQLMGGMVLHQGRIAEMKTGEGKTLVATLPLYLNALAGRGVHLVTVNDYLSKSHPYWMGPIYHALGMSVSSIQGQQATGSVGGVSFIFDPAYDSGKEDDPWKYFRPVTRKEAYLADITYGTNNEFGFDYLRDNMVIDLNQCVQRDLNYAIVDEVDNILIDEARTPLIISGPAEEGTLKKYSMTDKVARQLTGKIITEKEEMDAKQKGIDIEEGLDYLVDEKNHNVRLTGEGVSKAQAKLGIESVHEFQLKWEHYIRQAIVAHQLYKKNKEYVINNGKVVIVDEFTGRMMHGRRYSDGLHQAIEAKEVANGERVHVEEETRTYATVTFQNYFRMYQKLAGMTGTAVTEAEEFHKIYKLEVVVIPTNKPMIRQDFIDKIYKNEQAKFNQVVKEVEELNKESRPVLIGTVSVEKSEVLSDMMKRKGIRHEVLNAKLHEKEAYIVAQAGRLGAVTVATNMAGRGVDIILGGKPADYKPYEDVKTYIQERSKDFIERAEAILKEEKGYSDWLDDHRKKLEQKTRDFESERKVPEEIQQKYIASAGEQGTKLDNEEIRQREDKIRSSLRGYLEEYQSWENDIEQKLKQKSEELEIAGKPDHVQKIKEILKHKSQESKIKQDIDEIIGKHRQYGDWLKEHNEVVKKGGLHIIGTERHEARRIDNQLRGRAGRQGDPGSSRFYVSLEDDIMRRFGGDRVGRFMEWAGLGEDVPIENSIVNKTIESAQVRVEGYHFDLRKHLVEYDDVVNNQRKIIYGERRKILGGADLKENILSMVKQEIDGIVASHSGENSDGNLEAAITEAGTIMPLPRDINTETLAELKPQEIADRLMQQAGELYEKREREIGPESMRVLERLLMLRVIDNYWVEHLTNMDNMRQGVGLHAVAQRDPLAVYKNEGHDMFEGMMEGVRHDLVHNIFNLTVTKGPPPKQTASPMAKVANATRGGNAGKQAEKIEGKKIGRNDPCPCGSGKKYKHCCGK
jgi:preprotein translocase subunit SecA